MHSDHAMCMMLSIVLHIHGKIGDRVPQLQSLFERIQQKKKQDA
jgi:hypothetical protein